MTKKKAKTATFFAPSKIISNVKRFRRKRLRGSKKILNTTTSTTNDSFPTPPQIFSIGKDGTVESVSSEASTVSEVIARPETTSLASTEVAEEVSSTVTENSTEPDPVSLVPGEEPIHVITELSMTDNNPESLTPIPVVTTESFSPTMPGSNIVRLFHRQSNPTVPRFKQAGRNFSNLLVIESSNSSDQQQTTPIVEPTNCLQEVTIKDIPTRKENHEKEYDEISDSPLMNDADEFENISDAPLDDSFLEDIESSDGEGMEEEKTTEISFFVGYHKYKKRFVSKKRLDFFQPKRYSISKDKLFTKFVRMEHATVNTEASEQYQLDLKELECSKEILEPKSDDIVVVETVEHLQNHSEEEVMHPITEDTDKEVDCAVVNDNDESEENGKSNAVKEPKELNEAFTTIQSDLEESTEVLLGIEYLVEITEDQKEGEPKSYMCVLCEDEEFNKKSVVDHICGYLHKLAYLVKHFPSYSTQFIFSPLSEDTSKLATFCKTIEDQCGRNVPHITSRSIISKDPSAFREYVFNSRHFEEKDVLFADCSSCDSEEVLQVLKELLHQATVNAQKEVELDLKVKVEVDQSKGEGIGPLGSLEQEVIDLVTEKPPPKVSLFKKQKILTKKKCLRTFKTMNFASKEPLSVLSTYRIYKKVKAGMKAKEDALSDIKSKMDRSKSKQPTKKTYNLNELSPVMIKEKKCAHGKRILVTKSVKENAHKRFHFVKHAATCSGQEVTDSSAATAKKREAIHPEAKSKHEEVKRHGIKAPSSTTTLDSEGSTLHKRIHHHHHRKDIKIEDNSQKKLPRTNHKNRNSDKEIKTIATDSSNNNNALQKSVHPTEIKTSASVHRSSRVNNRLSEKHEGTLRSHKTGASSHAVTRSKSPFKGGGVVREKFKKRGSVDSDDKVGSRNAYSRYSRSPPAKRQFSPSQKFSPISPRSPRKRARLSPSLRRSRSPRRKRSSSPARRQSRSPAKRRRRSRSPARRYSRSPGRRQSRSPVSRKRRSPTPPRRRYHQDSRTPPRVRVPSPFRMHAYSPPPRARAASPQEDQASRLRRRHYSSFKERASTPERAKRLSPGKRSRSPRSRRLDSPPFLRQYARSPESNSRFSSRTSPPSHGMRRRSGSDDDRHSPSPADLYGKSAPRHDKFSAPANSRSSDRYRVREPADHDLNRNRGHYVEPFNGKGANQASPYYRPGEAPMTPMVRPFIPPSAAPMSGLGYAAAQDPALLNQLLVALHYNTNEQLIRSSVQQRTPPSQSNTTPLSFLHGTYGTDAQVTIPGLGFSDAPSSFFSDSTPTPVPPPSVVPNTSASFQQKENPFQDMRNRVSKLFGSPTCSASGGSANPTNFGVNSSQKVDKTFGQPGDSSSCSTFLEQVEDKDMLFIKAMEEIQKDQSKKEMLKQAVLKMFPEEIIKSVTSTQPPVSDTYLPTGTSSEQPTSGSEFMHTTNVPPMTAKVQFKETPVVQSSGNIFPIVNQNTRLGGSPNFPSMNVPATNTASQIPHRALPNDNTQSLIAQKLASVLIKLGMVDVPGSLLSEMLQKINMFRKTTTAAQDLTETEVVFILEKCGFICPR